MRILQTKVASDSVLARNVYYLMRTFNKTHTDLAEEMGSSAGTNALLLGYTEEISLGNAIKLAKYFDVSLDDLCLNEDFPVRLLEIEKERFLKARDSRRKVYAHINSKSAPEVK